MLPLWPPSDPPLTLAIPPSFLQASGAFALGLAGYSFHNQYRKVEAADPVTLAMNGALAIFGGAMVAQGFRK